MKIKKGDNVIVITGRDKGKKGTVVKALPTINKVVVEGVNMRKKHQKPRKSGEKGSMIETPRPLHVSNVKNTDTASKKKVASKKKAA
ncbi:50S ribosomal protein L24 [Candidatus Nomurabacteria bacterium]|jgi:large subunit ribosomal protein L24|nr:50S ribosomal protein L24 [Candidatus Nomurabacteria bacterium]